MSRSRPGRRAAALFAGLWLFYGATIAKYDLYDYPLQYAVVEAIVERGTFEVGGSRVPLLGAAGDKFLYRDRWLPAKQPGQFMLGALVYAPLRLAGLDFVNRYLTTAALVTWLTASLLSALAGAFLFRLVIEVWEQPEAAAWFCALGCGVGTILLPYSGIAHHDVMAVSMLVIAFFLIERAVRRREWERRGPALLAGLLMGAALLTSMLPAVVTAVMAAHVLLTRERRFVLTVAGGSLGGLLPLAAYNWHYFGNPLMQANLAGGYTDTVFSPDPGRFLEHLGVYLGLGDVSVLKYEPILLVGLAGLVVAGGGMGRARHVLRAAAALHLFYVLNIPAIGYCQYGPRFLIPLVPFVMMGVPAALARLRNLPAAPALLASSAACLLAVWSFLVNLMGSLAGTMYCETTRFAFPVYLRMPLGAQLDSYPLALLCGGALAALAALAGGRALLRGPAAARQGP